jgi:hypothetical protein
MRLRDRLDIDAATQRRVTRLMELSLVGICFIGLERGAPGLVVNAAVGLGVARVPGILERDLNVPMDAGLALWITAAAFLHAVGALELYSVSGFDHLTHALSASVVAGAGYAVARAYDVHDDRVDLPPRFLFALVLLLVVAFGVLWEILEFALGGLASLTGVRVLTQHGIEDTMLDLVFNTVGAVLVATWGTARLSGVVEALGERIPDR